ncbi:hypothetical protein BEWA_018510 [Theileria equi strain WA]|uniref:Uncharacterized protein n=1 Tax=Theileria equi strain WA TaxID=1537102 RepID=L0AVG2_THEEQ|nr:hypothetical protein BEWA_018510 [Theileria equi strain WA]AFZ79006.1 hypothetical protein BEWA_018510 [Theileria equi strain WA]|eukprot:XP_004828672.1 hypothetical protein BEWA_018510 [Theileria equi strain WA]
MDYVIRHAEVLCLSERLNLEQGLRFLSSLNAIQNIPKNCLIAIGETIEISDFSTVEEMLILDALDSSCKLSKEIDFLCVNKLFDEVCNILEHSKSTNHYRNLTILNTMITFKIKDNHITNLVFSSIKRNIASSTLYELCQYLFLSGELNWPEQIDILRRGKCIQNVLSKTEFIKSYEKLLEDKSLAIKALSGILRLSNQLTSKELKLLLEISQSSESLPKSDIITLYSALAKSNSTLGDEFEFIRKTIIKEAWNLSDLSPLETCRLLDIEDNYLPSDIPISKLNAAFDSILGNINLFDKDEIVTILNFASRNDNHSKRLLDALYDIKYLLKSPKAAVALIKLHKRCGISNSQLLYDILDGLCDNSIRIHDSLKIQLTELLQKNNIKHYTLASKLACS